MNKSDKVNFWFFGIVLVFLALSVFSQAPRAETPEALIPVPEKAILVADSFDTMNQGEWESLAKNFRDNPFQQELTLEIRGNGGSLDIVNTTSAFLRQARALGKKIHMRVIGPSISGHAFITCQATDLQMDVGTTLFFHQAFSIETYLNNTVYIKNTDQSPYDRLSEQTLTNDCVKAGILTLQDVKALREGKAVVIEQYADKRLKRYTNAESIMITKMNIANVAYLVVLGLISLSIIVAIKKI